jgi:hypothetical protein
MELKENWQLAAKSVIVVFLLFVTSIHIDLENAIINVNSLRNVMRYHQQWIFVGSDEQYSSFIDRELKQLQKIKKELQNE